LIFFYSSNKPVVPTANPAVSGWSELGSCAYTTSLDGQRELSLSDDGSATILDDSPLKDGETIKEHTIEGRWYFDDATKRYTAIFNGEATDYLVVSPERIYVCILVKGEPGAADLRASWFSSAGDDQGDTDPEPVRGD
jgi:hypothetical protein